MGLYSLPSRWRQDACVYALESSAVDFKYVLPQVEEHVPEHPDNKLISVRTISARDAEAAAELSGQLGYKASSETMRNRIEKLLCNGGSQAAFVACVGADVVAWIEIAIVQHLQLNTAPHAGGRTVVREDVRSRGIGEQVAI